MEKPNFSIKVEKTALIILNLFAIINIRVLFITPSNTLEALLFRGYTFIVIFALLFFHVIRFVNRGISSEKVRNLIPDIIFILVAIFIKESERVFLFYLLGRQTFMFIRGRALASYEGKSLNRLAHNPPIFVLSSFMIAIFIGTLLLLLPKATVNGEHTSLLDALFTSTSATCVTGLIVKNTGMHFSLFGKSIILLLIQIGGLGIMTVSSAFAMMLGQKLTVSRENLIQGVVGESNKVDMLSLLKSIFFVTIIFEIIGALLLYPTFKKLTIDGEFLSNFEVIYYSIFHSISAFCNAGFSLFDDSFIRFRSNFNINFVITFLIIFGGIGFPVLVDIKRNFKEKFRFSRFSLHTKIVLFGTAFLLVLGFVSYFISEYNYTMKNYSLVDRIYSSYFQSVTTRTAGFNTIDTSALSKPSVFTSVLFMFIGASPGSTGGGIKTTAFVILVIAVIAMLRGSRDVNIFKRKVAESIINKVMVLITISLTLLSVMIFLLLIIEPFSFEQTIFEAFSAFGTVGLSMGITPFLSSLGKVIIVILMYFGRVGPLTLIFAISEMNVKTSYLYTEEKIGIG